MRAIGISIAPEVALVRAGEGVMADGLSPRRVVLPLLLFDGRWVEARRLALAARDQGTHYARHEAMAVLARPASGGAGVAGRPPGTTPWRRGRGGRSRKMRLR